MSIVVMDCKGLNSCSMKLKINFDMDTFSSLSSKGKKKKNLALLHLVCFVFSFTGVKLKTHSDGMDDKIRSFTISKHPILI